MPRVVRGKTAGGAPFVHPCRDQAHTLRVYRSGIRVRWFGLENYVRRYFVTSERVVL